MDNRRLYVWSAFVAAAILVFFAVGTLFDLKVSELLYMRDNAFGKIYEAIGKMPAFVLSVFACFVLGENARKNEKNKVKRVLFYVLGYLAGILAFLDLGEMILDSTKFALAVGAVLSVPLAGVAYSVTRRIPADNLAAFKKWALVVLFSVAVVAVLVFVLKTIWGRARFVDTQISDAEYSPWYKLARVGGDSFPSGHAALGGTLFLLLPLCGISEKFRGKEKTVFVIAVLFAAVVMAARISDGHHYLSDVAVGFGIAFFTECLVMRVAYGKKFDRLTFDTDTKLERLLDAVF